MAIPVDIDQLIQGNIIESERIEFKKSWHLETIMHTICAFANDINNLGGGYIVIGIEEEKGCALLPPRGLDILEIDHIQKKLVEVCKRLQPNYFPSVVPMVYKNRHIIVIWAFGGDARPYKAPVSMMKGSPYHFYIRRNSTTVKTSIHDEHDLIRMAHRIPFDDRINSQASIAEFNPTLIKQYLFETRSTLYDEFDKMEFSKLCRLMQIARGSEELLKPVNAGLLMFTDDPEIYFPYARIEIVTYLDDIGDQFREKYFKGPIHHQLSSALQYIRNEIIVEQVQKIDNQAEAHRFFNYPFSAIEEALANAVYHKDYDQRSPIEVNIRLNQIDILSRPGPLPPITMKDLNSREIIIPREYRNRRIGDYLKELNLTEGRSTGLPKINRAFMLNGSLLPKFEVDKDRLYFLAIFPIHPDFNKTKRLVTKSDKLKSEAIDFQQIKNSRLVTFSDKLGQEAELGGFLKLEPLAQRVLALCRQGPHTTKMLAKKLNRNPRVVFRTLIKPLLEQKLIQQTNPNPQASNQAYISLEI